MCSMKTHEFFVCPNCGNMRKFNVFTNDKYNGFLPVKKRAVCKIVKMLSV